MLSPLPRRSDWDHSCSFTQPYQPSPMWPPGRPAQRPFRGLLSVHSRYGLHTRAATIFAARFTEGFNHFVTSTVAPVASGWSRLPGGTLTHWESAALTRRTPGAAIAIQLRSRLADVIVEQTFQFDYKIRRKRSPCRTPESCERFIIVYQASPCFSLGIELLLVEHALPILIMHVFPIPLVGNE